MHRAVLPFALALVLAVPSASIAADVAAAEKAAEQAEKSLTGLGAPRNLSAAAAGFKKARDLLPKDGSAEDLAARISIGLAGAYSGQKKHKEAAEELRPLAQGLAEKAVPWKGPVFPKPPWKEWMEELAKAREEIEGGKDAAAAAGRLKALLPEMDKNPSAKSYAQAARFLVGLAAEKAKKFEEAAGLYTPLAQARAAQVAAEAKSRREREDARPRTPVNIPAAPAPPGRLDGKSLETVEKGLDWLAKFQKPTGEWAEAALEELGKDDPLPPGRVKAYPTPVAAPLALAAFLRAGVQPGDGKRGEALKRGLEWALQAQGEDGRFPKSGYDSDVVLPTALFAQALAEAAARLPDPAPARAALEKAAALLVKAQNPGKGWRHGIRPGDNDSEHTASALIALARARAAGIAVPDEAVAGGLSLLEALTDEVTGKVGYSSRGAPDAVRYDSRDFLPGENATALSLVARILLGENAKSDALVRGYDTLWGRAPGWVPGRDLDLEYMRNYSLAYALRPGRDASHNLQALADLVVANQEKEKSAAGSWAPIGAQASDGRIAETARAILVILNVRGVNLPAPAKGGAGK